MSSTEASKSNKHVSFIDEVVSDSRPQLTTAPPEMIARKHQHSRMPPDEVIQLREAIALSERSFAEEASEDSDLKKAIALSLSTPQPTSTPHQFIQ